jgi:hypothetical protein
LRQRYVTTRRNASEGILNSINPGLPDGFAEPNGEAVYLQPAPSRSHEMTKFVDKNEQVEEQKHFKKNESYF